MDHLTICLAQQQHAVHISYDEQRVDLIPLEQRFRWVTFFSHPADKGREVMLEYNERAAISRIIIPAIIENWSISHPKLYDAWQTALERFRSSSASRLETLSEALGELPEAITFRKLEQDY